MEETNSGTLAVAQMNAPVKLTDWANEPKLADLQQNLTDARPAHQNQITKIENWLNHLHMEGTAALPPLKANEQAKGSRVQPKLIRKQAEWRYPALSGPFLSTSDIFNVKPVSFEDTKAARQNQLVLNNQFNTKIGKVRFINNLVRTFVNEGTAICEVGWCFEEKEYQEQVPDARFFVDPQMLEMMQHLDQMEAESPSEYKLDVPEELKQAHQIYKDEGQPIRPEIVGYKTVTKKRTVRNHPTVTVRDFRNILFDPTGGDDFDQKEFAIGWHSSSLAQLRKEGKYKNLEFIVPSQNSPLADPDMAGKDAAQTGFSFKDAPRQKIVVYTYWGWWDIDGNGITKPIIASWVGNTLIRMEELPMPDGELPFVVIPFLPEKDSLYGEPDGALLIDNQKILGALVRGMIDLMGKSANSQTGYAKNFLDATNRKKFEKGDDYEFNPNADPRQAVFMHTFPEIPQSAFLMMQQQNQDAESLTGVRSFSEGVSGASLGDVAAGIRGALDAASKREADILQRLADGIIKIGRKMIALNAELLSEEEVVRITNEEFVTVRRDDLQGNFDLELSISTAEEDHTQAQDLGFLLQTVGPNSPPDMMNLVLAKICRLRKMPDLAHQLETYQPKPDPLTEKKVQLEIALLEAQLATERAKARSLESGAVLSEAKVGTEEAKAKQLTADADLKNLDFVEQESGVHQEREKELQGAQARANMQLEGMKHELKREEIHVKSRTDLLKEYVKARNNKSKQK